MPSDKDLVQNQLLAIRCRRGDRDAWDQLIAVWQPRLFYYLRRLLPGEEDAWDMLQQTWMTAYEGIDRLADPKRLAPWLYRIARNKAIDQRRRLSLNESLDDQASDLPISGDEQCAFDDAETVHRALDHLSLAHREALTLFFLQEFSHDEIAEVLNIPPGTVKSRLHHAKIQLRHFIEKEANYDIKISR